MKAAARSGGFSEPIAEFLRRRAGLEFGPHRHEDARNGLRRAMARAGAADEEGYLRLLQDDAAVCDDLLAELTVGETYFFREPAQFDFIRREVLPERRRDHGPAFSPRAWSAGCASGEEAYSLAILLDEEGYPRSRVIGTDLSRPSLARARNAVYGRWSLRASEPAFLERRFRRRGEQWRLESGLASRVEFEYLNLASDHYPSLASGVWGLDLVLCRNVLIYFGRETVAAVARRLFQSLGEGGWLITGPSDPPLGELAPFETVVTPAGVFYRRPAKHGRFPGPAPRPAPERVHEPSPLAPAPPPEAAPREPAGAGACPAADRIRAIAASRGSAEAERAAAEEASRDPLSTELAFLRAALLMDLQRDEEAAAALRRALYLDRSLLIAHFMLGCVLRRGGDLAGARKAYRNALELGALRPAGEPVPYSDGESVEQLLRAASAELGLLAGRA